MTSQSTGRRLPPALIWLAIPVVIAGLAFAWWTISPLFINTRVDEAFPTSAPAAAQQPMDDAVAAETVAEEGMAGESMPAEAMPGPTVAPAAGTMAEEAMADEAMGEEMMADEAMGEEMMAEDTMAEEAMAEPTAAPAEPVALASGSFTQIDALHGAEGSATIYRLPEGNLVLRLENFNAQNGPDLRVGLSGHPIPRSSAELHEDGYVELAVLKANQGNQNYELPADLDPSAFRSVVIYCKAFSVVFSTAELSQ
jgi:hypothetical protein